ncbi:Sas10/Utp3 family protein-like protein [Byssothecium circinans]|uniref:Sas10/Utp3 family protein-like protein n=1 Tax=Byssothecium circinans TaxID=147558 RepID=A0A6A5TNQ8_9PLEO|nr:Sas10/Utp3 family protein-like protein [Byssothecium circinans]
MGKKRKAGGRYGESKTPKEENSKLAISTYEDVADSEDEFLINRDKILLDEGPAAKKLRKWKEEDKFLEPSDEEVLDYRGLDDEEEEDEDDFDAEEGAEASEDDVEDRKKDIDGDEDMEGWGPSKKDYYNADTIETEQDALDEEAEARRLQKKQLQAMTEADFGFDEDEWLGQDGDKGAVSGVVTEVLPQLQITDDMGEAEKLKILRTRYPEFEHVSNEFLRLQPLHDELAAAANVAERLIKSRAAKSETKSAESLPTPVAVTKYRACAAYLAAMSMYFAILGSTATDDSSAVIAMDPAELHDHPVMESLLKCQQLWNKVESLPVADPMVKASNNDDLSVIEEDAPGSEVAVGPTLKSKDRKSKRTKAERAAELAQAKSDARRAEKLRQTEQELASLAALTDKKAQKASRKKKVEQPKVNLLNPDDSDFGEETELTAHELAEKARKKKSLRFYTSQIAQKANKRDAAGKDYGGDADIPHRERLKDRQARLQAQAEKKGQNVDKGPGVPLSEGGESSGDDADDAQPNPNDFEDAEGYYDMVAARSTAKKQDKLDRAAAYALAAKEGGIVVPEESIGEDGRRQITYAIEKNKGLTPHRKKSVRNPRVKKKLAFEAKKKKLKSIKPVFDAGKRASGAANYGGELTGIKKGLVRARRLG